MTESGRAPVTMDASAAMLAPLGIAGGAVYDARVGLAAQSTGFILLTRDARAIPTYSAVGARIGIIA
jgi:toxin FitB